MSMVSLISMLEGHVYLLQAGRNHHGGWDEVLLGRNGSKK